ncbi:MULTISPECIES: LPXTG cell wall anchor domain-containing protein [unclassified Microbacterium]|uniref:LPXTG cell wall anchor domain-containing protein n=1 Tax=unclassified Microbacterium TaxID=2609290 RepID=UPI003428D8A2
MKVPRLLVCAAALAVGLVAVSVGAPPAWAAPTTEVVQGQILRLVSVADWDAASSLLPGERVRWDVAVSADAPDPGRVALAVSASGNAPVLVDAELCMRPWEGSGCPGGATALESAWDIPRDGSEIALAEFASEETAYLRLWVALDPAGASDDGTITDIRVHARGAGESVVAGSDGLLPATGGSATPWAIGAGAALAAIGAGLFALRSRGGARASATDTQGTSRARGRP